MCLFIRIDVPGLFDGAQQAPTEISRYEVPDPSEYRNALDRRRRFHAPEQGGTDKQRGGHHAEHQSVDRRVDMTVVQVDGEGAVAHALENVAQVARQGLHASRSQSR